MLLLHVARRWVNIPQYNRLKGRLDVPLRPQVRHKVQKRKAGVQVLGMLQLSAYRGGNEGVQLGQVVRDTVG